MIVVAHQDDDIPILYPDLAERTNATTPLVTVYLTNGNAGLKCGDYTRGREEGVKQVHATLVGVPNQWRDEEQTIRGKLVRVSTLVGTQHSLVFFGFPNSPEENSSLEYLWSEEGARLSTMAIDGRSRVDSYSAEELIEVLRALMAKHAPRDVRIMDASRRTFEFYPFDHTDHVHSALFALAALQRYGRADTFTMYRGYNIQLEPQNLPDKVVKRRGELIDMYNKHDKKICEQRKVEICGEETRCFPAKLFEPFQSRRYTIDLLARKDTALRTQFARCVDTKPVTGGKVKVVMRRCVEGKQSQRWSVGKDGRIRNLQRDLCLSVEQLALGSELTLRECKDVLSQRFYLTSQGQLRGPGAKCVRSGLFPPTLQRCAIRMRQAGFRVEPE